MTDVFNSREIAMLCWLGVGVVLVLVLSKLSVSKPLWGVMRTLLSPWILIPIGAMALYSAIGVMLLAVAGFWHTSLLKDTIIWFCASALAMVMRVGTSEDADDVFWKVIAENFRIVILLEFLVNTYTFSLPAELILVPTVTLLAMLHEVAGLHRQHAAAARFVQTLQALIGFGILAIALIRAVSDLKSLGSVETL